MAFYVVKEGGTAAGTDNGRETVQPTGTFAARGAANYYDSILDANTNPTTNPTSGDTVYVSSSHNINYGATTTLLMIDGVRYVSVDDSNMDAYLEGASESATGGGYNLSLMAAVSLAECYTQGIFFKCQGNMVTQGNVDNRFVMDGGGLELTSAGANNIQFGRTGLVSLSNCSVTLNGLDQLIETRYGVQVKFNNVTALGGVAIQLFKMLLDGADIEIINSDLTDMGPNPTIVSVDDGCWLTIRSSLVAAGTSWIGGAFDARRASVVEISSVGVGTGVDDYHYYYDSPKYLGYSEENQSVYRTDGAFFNGSTRFSTKIVTESTVSQLDPQSVPLGSVRVDASGYTTTITFKAHFAIDGATTEFDSSEIWLVVRYKDGNQRALGLDASTGTEILATPVAPSTETGLWTGLGTNKQMSVSTTITIGTGAGQITDGWIQGYLCVGVPNLTSLYVCPLLEVS